MQVGPEDGAVDALGRLEHVVMVVPVDAEEDEAQDVGQKHRQQWTERLAVGAVRHLQLQHHDRDQYGEYAVAERFEPAFAHAPIV